MNQRPLNLTISDFTETRLSGYHAHWPVDPDTTARLNRITKSDPYAKPRFRDRHPLLAELLFAIIFLSIVALGFIAAVIIREAIISN